MSGCVNIALRDLLAGSVAGGYEGQPLKAGGAAQPGGCSACFVPDILQFCSVIKS